MTQAEVAKALGARLEGEPIEDEKVCVEKISPAHPDMWFMFLEGRLARISVLRNCGRPDCCPLPLAPPSPCASRVSLE